MNELTQRESKTKKKGARHINGGYRLRKKDPNRPAQKLMNELSDYKSFDSKDMRDEISKAGRCKTSGKMIKAIKHLKLGREMLENMIQKLEHKDKMKALEYFKNIF